MGISGVYELFNEKWCHQTVWIYSDPHFGDKDLPNRLSDEEQIKKINSKVGRKDTLIILGDVGNIDCVKKLRGYKVLICGNHDVGHTVYEEVFDEVYSGPLVIGEKVILSHEPLEISCMFNIHGHDHAGYKRKNHFNACAEHIDFEPVNMNRLMKSGVLSKVTSIHRSTIDNATIRKQRRGMKHDAK